MSSTTAVRIDTEKTPYIIERNKRPSNLSTSILSDKEWNEFCNKFDKKLKVIEEIMALFKVVTVILLVLYLLTTGGLVIRYVLVDDEISDTLGLIISIGLFVTYCSLFVFHGLFILHVISNRLQEANETLYKLCRELTESTSSTSNMEFRYCHSSGCKVVWTDKYTGWVEISSAATSTKEVSEPVV